MRRPVVFVFALLMIGISSCGSAARLYPVSGKVTVKGQPAVGATVTFVRKAATNETMGAAQGVVAEDGTFTLAGPAGKGAAPGEYIVLVEWKEGAGKTKGRAPALSAPDRLGKRYLDAANPALTAVVEARPNALPPFELE